jgi:hypothetical protein
VAIFRLGTDFPHEGFVHDSVRRHFEANGYINGTAGYVDFQFRHPTANDRWHIEGKGMTGAVGLDFRTGIGQCIQGMSGEAIKHAIAFPATDQFFCQATKIASWVRRRLNLHWLVVGLDGMVRVVKPDEEL